MIFVSLTVVVLPLAGALRIEEPHGSTGDQPSVGTPHCNAKFLSPEQFGESGIFVRKNMLPASTIDDMLAYYNELKGNPRYITQLPLRTIQEHPHAFNFSFHRGVHQLMNSLMELDRDNPGESNSWALDSVYFFGDGKGKYGWHVDHSSHWGVEDHVNYRNVYIPLTYSSAPTTQPLDVVPRNEIRSCGGHDLRSWAVNGGTRTYDDFQERWVGHDGQFSYPKKCFESMMCPLEFIKGDVAVLRGDTIHSSGHSSKVAASLRFVRSDASFQKQLILKDSCYGLSYAMQSHFYSFLLAEMQVRRVDRISLFDDARHLGINMDVMSHLNETGESNEHSEIIRKRSIACYNNPVAFLSSDAIAFRRSEAPWMTVWIDH
jgi:hypothetical protein